MSPFLLQYFEYTSQKEIRFNSVTELCAEVPEGQTFIGMRHCPSDGEVKPPSIIWEFRQVGVRAQEEHPCSTTEPIAMFVYGNSWPQKKNPESRTSLHTISFSFSLMLFQSLHLVPLKCGFDAFV